MNWKRCNFIEKEDGIYYCDGFHPRFEACEYDTKLTIQDLEDIIKNL